MDSRNTTDIIPILIVAIVAFGVICLIVSFYHQKVLRYKKMAISDSLTGSLSRIGFLQEASKLLDENKNQYVVVTLQIQNLQQLIYSFGMENINQDLMKVYGVLKSNLNKSEPIGRFNDSTFCFLLKARQEEAVRVRLARICETAERRDQAARIPCLRFGIYTPDGNTQSLEEILNMSSAFISSNKSDDRYCFIRSKSEDAPERKLKQVSQMKQALVNGEFVVYMQPKVRLSDNLIVGAEALIRWRNPQKGLLTPDAFLPILEEYHMLNKLDLYLFEQVCRQIAQWIRQGWTPVPVSVNVSYETLLMPNFARAYSAICQKYDVPPELLELELPGIVLQKSALTVNSAVEEIHRFNFRCALDSFGNGMIPINFLRYVSVDTLKLDQKVMSTENNNRRIRFVMEAILKLTTQLQISTVAEGIDNVTQIQFLKQIGCDMVQGYYFFRPMPMEEFCFRVFHNGKPSYAKTDENRESNAYQAAQQHKSSKITMFSIRTDTDQVSFSNLFSPVLEEKYVLSNATSLFRHSPLVHENDQTDFLRLLERTQKEQGWVDNTIRFYTTKGCYEWLEVHMHQESAPSGEGMIISGTLVNTADWNNEVNRWKEKANRDALTGLYNREYFEQMANAALEKGTNASYAIVFVDIDDFKQINDTLGHTVGDDVICNIGKRLLGAFRHTDVVARYGGDEFVVFVNGISREELAERLGQFCDSFQVPYRNDTCEYPVSTSIGAAMFPDDGKGYLQLLNHADAALYVAKRQGKKQFVMYHSDYEELSM